MRKANSSPVPVQHSRNDTVGRELSGLRDPEVSRLRGSQTDAIMTLRPQDYESTRPSKLEQRHQHPSRTSRLLCIMLRAAIGMVLFALSSGCNTTTTFACSSENTEYIILYVRTHSLENWAILASYVESLLLRLALSRLKDLFLSKLGRKDTLHLAAD
jgi:hypothetical protein